MSVCLNVDEARHVNSANYITFINGTPHPDRIMAEHDFLYMIDGCWEIMEEEAGHGDRVCCYSIQTDDLLILPAGRHHYGHSLCTPDNRHMYIHANPLAGDEEGAPGALVFDSVIHCQGNPHIRELFEDIIRGCWSSGSRKEARLTLMMSLLLNELAEQQERSILPGRCVGLAEEISRLIQAAPQTFFTAKELAQRYFVCERTLSNQFKKAFGKTLYTYQMDVKLEMVRQFLMNQPDVKLHETALNFGFCDEFHLSRTFHRKYGIPPSEYRELAKKQQQIL